MRILIIIISLLITTSSFAVTFDGKFIQGSFIIEELTDLVEEAVLTEFDRITDRGGVLGAMETMYQRSKIQEESLHYERLIHSGEFPVVGVNTFIGENIRILIFFNLKILATHSNRSRRNNYYLFFFIN